MIPPTSPAAAVTWVVVPLHTPRVLKSCRRCNTSRVFSSSDKFRVNAQRRTVDVWLIYMCDVCRSTWNCSILRRVAPRTLAPTLYRAFQENDRGTAWHYAFDVELLRRNGVVADPKVEFSVDGPEPDWSSGGREALTLRIAFAHAWRYPLHTLLAKRLPLSRSAVDRLVSAGGLTVWPPARNLRDLGRAPVQLTLHVPRMRELLESTRDRSAAALQRTDG